MIAVKTSCSFWFGRICLWLIAITRKLILLNLHPIKMPVQVLPPLFDLRIYVILIGTCSRAHLDHLAVLFNFGFVFALVWIKYLHYCLICLVPFYFLVPVGHFQQLFFKQVADGLVLLRGVDSWDALCAIWFHFLANKPSPVAKHTVRYVLIKVYVDSFDGSVLHGFTRNCVGKRVVTFFLPPFFLGLVLNSLTLMLVIPDTLRHDIGQIIVEFADPQSDVLLQRHLTLSAEELDALLIFAVCISEIVIRKVLLPELQVVSSGLHERLPLTQIQIKDMIDMRTHGHFVPGVVAIKGVNVSLNHCVMNFLSFVKLPTIHGLFQLGRVEALLFLFSGFLISFFFWVAFWVFSSGIVFVLFEFALCFFVLVHCFKSLSFSAFL